MQKSQRRSRQLRAQNPRFAIVPNHPLGKVARFNIVSATQSITSHTLRNPLPVPNATPFTAIHAPPNLLQQLRDPLRVSQACITLHRSNRHPYPFLLLRCEAKCTNHKARYQEKLLRGIAGLERVEDRKTLFDAAGDTLVEVRGLTEGWRRIDVVMVRVEAMGMMVVSCRRGWRLRSVICDGVAADWLRVRSRCGCARANGRRRATATVT